VNPSNKKTNRLAQESSPYLQQHAYNPVDWFPWGGEALERARELDRPIFLSIGYSACHWCHVMEQESFENPEVAQMLNENFVSIKVDREERPDLDQIYMTAVQMMTGQGGWPMTVFLTADLQPFYGGTYFPPEDRYGRPSFLRLLHALATAWRERRHEIQQAATEITENLKKANEMRADPSELGPSLLQSAARTLARSFDESYGGFGPAPKFPHPIELKLLLRIWKRFGDEEALRMADKTLERMAMGGIYDQIGGGFHRYSTDRQWLVPHFEKMLYDNALLTAAYAEAFQATGKSFYRDIVQEILTYVLREMTSPEGAFYSAQDADSEGEEGKFYVWSLAEVCHQLGDSLARLAADVYEITPEGNWEEHNILHRSKNDRQYAQLFGLTEADFRRQLDEIRTRLYDVRRHRQWPLRDEKILTSWNALMIDGLAVAAQALDRMEYAQAASRAARFLLDHMRQPDGRLWRTTLAGAQAKCNAYLEDYACLITALVSLYEATFVPDWLESALTLADVMIDQFWSKDESGFYYTGRDHENLIIRSREANDSSTPSSNAMAITALLRLAKLTGRSSFYDVAQKTLEFFSGGMRQAPSGYGQMLNALDFYLGPVDEFAVIGMINETECQKALRAIYRRFLPRKVVAGFSQQNDSERCTKVAPLLASKPNRGSVTTYICRNWTCQEPILGADALDLALNR
jgi:uncharacterized protein YyaL (SSP411 family)